MSDWVELKGKFKFWGTDGCLSCDTGRITLLVSNDKCIKCDPQSYERVTDEPSLEDSEYEKLTRFGEWLGVDMSCCYDAEDVVQLWKREIEERTDRTKQLEAQLRSVGLKEIELRKLYEHVEKLEAQLREIVDYWGDHYESDHEFGKMLERTRELLEGKK